jgi:HK97 family phage portal protein
MNIFKKIASLFSPTKKTYTVDELAHLDDVKRLLATQYYGPNSPETVFQKIAIAHRCMLMIGKGIADLPISLKDSTTGEEIDEDPIMNLLKMPNGLDTGRDLMQRLVIDYHLRGNAYWFITDQTFNPNITEIQPLFPQITTPADINKNPIAHNFGRNQEIKFFAGFLNDETGKFYPKEQVVNFKAYHPYHRILGLSVFESAGSFFNFETRVAAFKNYLYENQATPTGILSIPQAADLSAELADELKKKAKKEWGGVSHAGEIKVLQGGMTYQQIAWKPRDLELVGSENMTMAQIAMAFGVPSELLGNIGGQKNRSVYEEATRAFKELTLFPLGNEFYETMSKFFWPDGSRYIAVNIEKVRGFVPVVNELPYGMTIRQVLASQGQKTAEKPGEIKPIYDQILIPSGYEPIENLFVEPQKAPEEF